MTVLSASEIRTRLDSRERDNRLVITPLLDQVQIGTTSVDLRLGPWFITQTQSQVASINPGKPEDISARRRMYHETFVPFGEQFVLHPDQFVLGSTLEYFGLPLDIQGSVEGRSSWGRLGLIIATATGINPGYRGVVTLELRNIGEVPLHLWPGWWIAQIVFQSVDPPPDASTAGRYGASVKPAASTLRRDDDIYALERMAHLAPDESPSGSATPGD